MLRVNFSCNYTTTNNVPSTLINYPIKASDNLTITTDFQQNIKFPNTVVSIQTVSVDLILNNQKLLPLAIQLAPQLVTTQEYVQQTDTEHLTSWSLIDKDDFIDNQADDAILYPLHSKMRTLSLDDNNESYSDKYQVKKIKRDGNCLFRAISDQLKRFKDKPQFSSQELRSIAVNHIKDNMPEYQNFIEGDIVQYCENMEKEGVWGGEQEIRALAEYLSYQIKVIQSEHLLAPYGNPNHPIIYLAYNGNTHYDSLIPNYDQLNTKTQTSSHSNDEKCVSFASSSTMGIYFTKYNNNDRLKSNLAEVSEDAITTYQFQTTNTLLIAPVEIPQNAPSYITYLDTSKDRYSEFKLIEIKAKITYQPPIINLHTLPAVPAIIIDVTGMTAGSYPYSYMSNKSEFIISSGGPVYNSHSDTSTTEETVIPSHQYQYDRWDNITVEKNSMGHTTTMTYSARNHLLSKIAPQVTVVNENGTEAKVNPTTYYGTNVRGFAIGTTDANGHTEAYIIDAAGQQIEFIEADGTRAQKNIYDTLGRSIQRIDARNQIWYQEYNRDNKVRITISPNSIKTIYEYDEQGNRSAQIIPKDAAGTNTIAYHYNYDPLNNVIESYLPLGQVTRYTYERNHQLISQINADAKSLSWQRNYFGSVENHLDLGGANYTYEYDKKMQLIREYSNGGNHGTYLTFDQKTITYNDARLIGYPLPKNYYSGKPGYLDVWFATRQDTPGKSLRYTYKAGRLVQLNDEAHKKVSYYELDKERRRVGLRVEQLNGLDFSDNGNILLRQVHTTLDALGREVLTADTMMMYQTSYDAEDNIRVTKGYLYLPDADATSSSNPVPKPQKFYNWCRYDAADRAIIYNGILNNGVIQISPDQGLELGYSNGLRTKERTYVNKKELITNLNYYEDGLLKSSTTNDNSRIERIYDITRRWQISYTEYRNNIESSHHIVVKNDNGWQTHDEQLQNSNIIITDYENSELGLVVKQRTNYNKNNMLDELQLSYALFDTPMLTLNGGQRTNKIGKGPYSSAELLYDANGSPNSTLGVTDDSGANQFYFTTTPEGQIISKFGLTTKRTFDKNNSLVATAIIQENRVFYGLNGQPRASYFIGTDKPLAFVNIIPPISKNVPLPMEDHYVVVTGDTFETIAQKEYGDASFGLYIAEANGWLATVTPTPGQILKLPQMIPMHNDANTSPQYQQFISIMIGSVYPNLIMKRPKRHFLGSLILIISAAVITFFAPEIGAFVAKTMLSLAAGTITYTAVTALTAGVFAGFANAAVQGLVVGVGLQEHFSLQQVILTALSQATATGLFGTAVDTASVMAILDRSAKLAVIEQLNEMAIGLRKNFDLREIVSQISIAIIKAKYIPKLNNQIADTVINQSASSLLHGLIYKTDIRVDAIALNALGIAIGQQIAEPFANKLQKINAAHQDKLTAQQKTQQVPLVSTEYHKVQQARVQIGSISTENKSNVNNNNTRKITSTKSLINSIKSKGDNLIIALTMFNSLNGIPKEIEKKNIPILKNSKERMNSILKDTPAIFNIENLNANDPRYGEWRSINFLGEKSIKKYNNLIEEYGRSMNVDPDIIRTIMYLETVQGVKDHFIPNVMQNSILPMNIQKKTWQDLGFKEQDFYDPKLNIKAAITLIHRIEERLLPKDRTIDKIATLYNGLGKEYVTNYGARAKQIYTHKLWESPDNYKFDSFLKGVAKTYAPDAY